jgi:hypothetical protein
MEPIPDPYLIAEGQRLARQSYHLVRSEAAGPPAALWKGSGPQPLPGALQHWLTLDAGYLPPEITPHTGMLSVYAGSRKAGLAVAHPELRFPPASPGSAMLYARQVRSYPPIDAIFQYGSETVRRWLAAIGWMPPGAAWSPAYAYDERFPDPRPVREYEQFVEQRHPLFTRSAVAVIGGWHVPWPEGDWHDLLADTLVCWTLEDAEPWVEVWWSSAGGFRVISRFA